LAGGERKRQGWHFETAKQQVFAAAEKLIKKDDVALMKRQIDELKKEKMALTRLGRNYFTTKIQAQIRGVLMRKWIGLVKPLFIKLQALTRGRAARLLALDTKKQKNAILIAKIIRGFIVLKNLQIQRKAALLIAKWFRGHAVRRQSVKFFTRAHVRTTIATRISKLLIGPDDDTQVLTTKIGNSTTWLESHLKPENQPIGIQIKIDSSGDLGLFFVANPQTDIRHVLAPYQVSGIIEISLLHNAKLNADVTVRIDDLYSDQGFFQRRVGNATVGVQSLIPKSEICNFLHHHDFLVLTIKNILPSKIQVPNNTSSSLHEDATVFSGRKLLAAVASSAATCPVPSRRAFIL